MIQMDSLKGEKVNDERVKGKVLKGEWLKVK